MQKIVNLSLDQVVDRIMELGVGEKFDFAGGIEERDLEKATKDDLLYWYGAKAVHEFDQDVLLLGYYGGGPTTAISLEDDESYVRDNIKQALLEFDVADWEHAGCYVVEDVKEQYKTFEETLTLNKVNTDYVNRLLREIPQTPDECLMGEDDSFSFDVKFENGYKMVFCIHGVEFEEAKNNLPWTEAILYDDNNFEVCVCDGCEEFFGTWRLPDPDKHNLYVVKVEESPNKERIIKIGDLKAKCESDGTYYITVKDNSTRGASSTNVNAIEKGDYVLIDDHFTRVVPDDLVENTYPVYEMSDCEAIAKEIAKYNKKQERCAMVNGELKELPVLLNGQGADETLIFLRNLVDAEVWEGIVPMESIKLPSLEVRDEIMFNKDANQIEMTQTAFEWFEKYAAKHNEVSELEGRLLAHIRSTDEIQSFLCADAEAKNLDQSAELKKEWLLGFAKRYSISLKAKSDTQIER